MSGTRIGIVGLCEAIREDLARALAAVPLRWKGGEGGYIETVPTVEAFVYAKTDADGWPHCPAVLVQPLEYDGDFVHMALHIAVVHPAIIDEEKTIPADGSDGEYVYKHGEGFGSNGVRRELYLATLMLCEQCILSIQRSAAADIELERAAMPSPALDSFPYAECSIIFKARASNVPAAVGSAWADLL